MLADEMKQMLAQEKEARESAEMAVQNGLEAVRKVEESARLQLDSMSAQMEEERAKVQAHNDEEVTIRVLCLHFLVLSLHEVFGIYTSCLLPNDVTVSTFADQLFLNFQKGSPCPMLYSTSPSVSTGGLAVHPCRH